MNCAENEPVPLAVTLEGDVETGVPSNIKVMPELSMKFEPVTMTVVPTVPVWRLSVMLGVITVKLTDA